MRILTNFLKETLGELEDKNKTIDDVLWVGTKKYKVDKNIFFNNIDFNYDSGFGNQQIPSDLIIVGKGWYMERNEHDGSEWWEFRTTPEEPEEVRVYANFQGRYWQTLQEINEVDQDDYWMPGGGLLGE